VAAVGDRRGALAVGITAKRGATGFAVGFSTSWVGKQVPAQQILDSTAKASSVITDRMICAGESALQPGSTLVIDTC
jgi:hypothetical protein